MEKSFSLWSRYTWPKKRFFNFECGVELGKKLQVLPSSSRRVALVAAWSGVVFAAGLLLGSVSWASARAPDSADKAPVFIGPQLPRVGRPYVVVVAPDGAIESAVAWTGLSRESLTPNALSLRDGEVTASADTFVTSSQLTRLLSGSSTVQIRADEIYIAPNAGVALPGARISLDARRVVIGGAIDVSASLAGSIVV
ncbi:MAG: hypothetical protein KJS66_11535, partial [Acidobacteria bacterium]|nr:hypothetical protein [Acidobacteriota bacterium]